MVSSVSHTFRNQEVNVAFEKIQSAMESGIRVRIEQWRIKDDGGEECPGISWDAISLVMSLFERSLDAYGWKGVVELQKGVGFWPFYWYIYPDKAGATWPSVIPELLQKVDGALVLVGLPLKP